MPKLIAAIAFMILYSLVGSILSIILGSANAFWMSFTAGMGGLLGNIVAGILNEEALNMTQLRRLATQLGISRVRRRRWMVAALAGLTMTLLVVGSLFKFVDFRATGNLNGFSKDVGFITYIIDNSGSMGCKAKEGFRLNDGYCSETGNYQVRLAKQWVREDFQSLNSVERLKILEVGGLTKETEIGERCKIETLIDAKDVNLDSLDTALNEIKANSSGATNLSGAIIQAAEEVISSEGKNQQVIIISDLEHNCGEPDVAGIVSELSELGWDQETVKSTMDEVVVFSLSPTPSERVDTSMLGIQMATIGLPISPVAALTKKQEIRALRQQGIRVIDLKDFNRLERLSIPINFNFNFWRIFSTSLLVFVVSQIALSLSKGEIGRGELSLVLGFFEIGKENDGQQISIPPKRKRRNPNGATGAGRKDRSHPESSAGEFYKPHNKNDIISRKVAEHQKADEIEIVLNWAYPKVKYLSLVATWRDEKNDQVSVLDSIEINDESSEKYRLFRVGTRSEIGGPTSIILCNKRNGSYLISVEDVYRREDQSAPGISNSHGVVEMSGAIAHTRFICPRSLQDKDRWNVCIVKVNDSSISITKINKLDNYKI